MHDPREPHLTALKQILRYVRGTLHLGLLLRPSALTDLVVYTDADWASHYKRTPPLVTHICVSISLNKCW
jgi:hypothetical protein